MKILKSRLILLCSSGFLFTVIFSLLAIIGASGYFKSLEYKKAGENLLLAGQVSNNLEAAFKSYKSFISNFSETASCKNIINSKGFNSVIQEYAFHLRNKFNHASINSSKKSAFFQDICIIDPEQSSFLTHEDYSIYYPADSSFIINYNRLITDPIYLLFKRNKSTNFAFGKPQAGVINGKRYSSNLIIISSINKKRLFNEKFFLIILSKDFTDSLLSNIQNLDNKIVYIIDNYNNIISTNNNVFIGKNNLFFADITRSLDAGSDKNKLSGFKNNDKKYIARYNNTDYLTVSTQVNVDLGCRILLYQPLNQIHPSIMQLILFLVVVIAFIICIFFVVSLFRKKI